MEYVKTGACSLPSLFSDLSSRVPCDVALLQEVFKTLFRDSEPVFDSGPDESDGTGTPQHSLPIETEIEAAHSHGYQVYSNTGDFSAAVVLNRNLDDHVKWQGTCICFSAVTLGHDDVSVLFASAYFPQRGLGLDLFIEAIAAVSELIRSAPPHKELLVGCDGNCKLFEHENLPNVVGPVIFPFSNPCLYDRARFDVFITMALDHQLRATNTFLRPDRAYCPEELREQTACSWTHALFTDTNVRSQMDWILCSQSRGDACSTVVHDLDCGSEHKLILLQLLQGFFENVRPPSRQKKWSRGMKGWQPLDAAAAKAFVGHLQSLPSDVIVGQFQDRLKVAVAFIPFYRQLSEKTCIKSD